MDTKAGVRIIRRSIGCRGVKDSQRQTKPKKPITIVEAIKNPKLFGSLFKSLDTWRAWMMWLKAVFGLPMDRSELELFQKCTGRSSPPPNGVNEVFTSRYLSAGERGMVLILARDKDQAKVVFSHIGGILRAIPALE